MSTKKKVKSSGSAAAPVKLSEPLQQCHAILKVIQAKQDAAPFLEPVDWEYYGYTDYPDIITHPMDLGTVQTKLETGKYATPDAFAKEVRLVWKNAMTYNRPDSDIYMIAEKLKKLFDRQFAKVKKGGADKKRKRSDKDDVQVTRQDRLKFSQLAIQLSGDELGQLVDILQKDCPEALNEEDEEELEVDINNIDAASLMSLTKFADSCILNKQKKLKK